MTAQLHYLTGRTRMECHTPGFHDIPVGTILPMEVVAETIIREGTRTAADGSTRKLSSKRKQYQIQLTGPDGTRHRFHTDPASIITGTPASIQPAGREESPILHHSIQEFLHHFHTPAPEGLALPCPKDHALLDLLEAIVTAATSTTSPSPA